jgi:hypothetical protein
MYCIRSLLHGSWAGAKPRHYNDVRTPAIWTGAIKNEDINSSSTPLHVRVSLPHLLRGPSGTGTSKILPETITVLESARNARPCVNRPLISIKKIWRPAEELRSEQPANAIVSALI